MPLGPKQSRVSAKQKVFIDEYVASKSPTDAARKAGFAVPNVMGFRLLDEKQFPLVAAACKTALARQSERALKKGDDILKFIHGVMYTNWSRWFLPGDDGTWTVSESDYKNLPDEVGQFIEEITKHVREDDSGREVWFKVRLVSKTTAMALAAKHQLGEKMTITNVSVNWDDLLRGKPPAPEDDPVEVEILSVRGNQPAIEAPKTTGKGKGK
jgi:hypothetical protein